MKNSPRKKEFLIRSLTPCNAYKLQYFLLRSYLRGFLSSNMNRTKLSPSRIQIFLHTSLMVFLRYFLFTYSQFCLQRVKQYNVDNSELLEKTGLFISLLSLAQVILKKKWTQIRHSRFKYAINQNWLELSMYGRKKEGSSSSVHIVMSLMH